jgi:hypothetical protein
MPKPTEHASLICTICTILALIGIILGFVFHNSLFVIFFLIPTVGYEIYRTEGSSTKFSSIAIAVILLAELILIIFHINYDLIKFLGTEQEYVAGYSIPLGDIKIVGPFLLAIFSIILFIRTYGVYTKWLAVIVFVSSFVIVYVLDPNIFSQMIKFGVREILNRSYY